MLSRVFCAMAQVAVRHGVVAGNLFQGVLLAAERSDTSLRSASVSDYAYL